MRLTFDPASTADYRLFLRVKSLPHYRIVGRTAIVPDEYAARLGIEPAAYSAPAAYWPIAGLFDYQRDISALAIRRRKFAVFADPGLGKTLIATEFARAAAAALPGRRVLVVSPLMVVDQTIAEVTRFYGQSLRMEPIPARRLPAWSAGDWGDPAAIGITNYEALSPAVPRGRLGALILDESSMLKSHYGAWGRECIRLGRGLEWKLALTGTPAPNDRIEYANHAVLLDAFPNVNSFLGRYFVNRGQTGERWELKPHALRPFYRALSHWCIFLTNPATYGWRDNVDSIPPVLVNIHDVPMTAEQRALAAAATGTLFPCGAGGITSRSALSRLAKGSHAGRPVATDKPAFIRALVDSWPGESTLIWCHFNDEQAAMERSFPEALSLKGDTPYEDRRRAIGRFQAGEVRVLISKSKVLGWGLNLQVATRQVFNGLKDSYEEFYQCVKRSNRVGSTRPLSVHVPVTDVERPLLETVLAKAARVQRDTVEQEALFRDAAATLDR